MSAANFPLAIEAGATFKLTLTVRTGTETGAPAMNLTGWTPRMQIRSKAGALGVLLDCRAENDRLSVISAENGQLQLTIEAEDTARMEFEAAVYDLIITHTSGEVRRLLQGAVTVSKAVTR